MSLKYAQRRDGNEGDIVDALRRVGAMVEYMEKSCGFDMLVCWFGRVYIVEVKQPGKKLEKAEAELADRMKEAGCQYHIWHNPEEALGAIGAIW